jgi:hypothetical protein
MRGKEPRLSSSHHSSNDNTGRREKGEIPHKRSDVCMKRTTKEPGKRTPGGNLSW